MFESSIGRFPLSTDAAVQDENNTSAIEAAKTVDISSPIFIIEIRRSSDPSSTRGFWISGLHLIQAGLGGSGPPFQL
jgi:hypothetical protein